MKDATKEEIATVTQPLRDEITALKQQISAVKEKANYNEQYSRPSNIRIFGLVENHDEN